MLLRDLLGQILVKKLISFYLNFLIVVVVVVVVVVVIVAVAVVFNKTEN